MRFVVMKSRLRIRYEWRGNWSLRALAEQFFISQSYLSNLFRSEVGVTLVEYINSSRMKRAAGMLTESNLSITAIAERVGIFDVNYFMNKVKEILPYSE